MIYLYLAIKVWTWILHEYANKGISIPDEYQLTVLYTSKTIQLCWQPETGVSLEIPFSLIFHSRTGGGMTQVISVGKLSFAWTFPTSSVTTLLFMCKRAKYTPLYSLSNFPALWWIGGGRMGKGDITYRICLLPVCPPEQREWKERNFKRKL